MLEKYLEFTRNKDNDFIVGYGLGAWSALMLMIIFYNIV